MASYSKPPQPPLTFTRTAESVTTHVDKAISQHKESINKLVSHVAPEQATFNTVLGVLEQLDDDIWGPIAGEVDLLEAVSTDTALRDACSEASKKMGKYFLQVSQRNDVFELISAVVNKKENLNAEDARVLDKEYKKLIRLGLGLPDGPAKKRFADIKACLVELQSDFNKNVNEDKGGVWHTREQLEGVPKDVIEDLREGEAEGENAGKLFVSHKYPHVIPVLQTAKNSATRKNVYMSFNDRCGDLNEPLFGEVVLLRDEAARLLGHSSHASVKLEPQMAATPEVVNDFLQDLKTRLRDRGLKDIEGLLALKSADLKERGLEHEDDGHFYLWDNSYYTKRFVEKACNVDDQAIKQYFPLEHAFQGMMKIYEDLFGLVFVEIIGEERDKLSATGKGSDLVWHPDVKLYAVWDSQSEGGKFAGYIYYDLYPRDDKYGHAACFTIKSGYSDAHGQRHYPVCALVCNFPKPTDKKPSLLTHDEVETSFHELGHGIHSLVSRTKYSRFHGTSVARDFVEAPSQMLENWVYEPKQLAYLSRHYSYLSPEYKKTWQDSASNPSQQPPETLPNELIDNIISARHVLSASHYLRQLFFGSFDMMVHDASSHERIEKLDITESYNKLRKELGHQDGPELVTKDFHFTRGHASFAHLMGGYDAGYYGYLWSEVYSADMYATAFKKDPTDPVTGRRYRYTVLEKGGERDEMESLTEFLGRKPNNEAFYELIGLKQDERSRSSKY